MISPATMMHSRMQIRGVSVIGISRGNKHTLVTGAAGLSKRVLLDQGCK